LSNDGQDQVKLYFAGKDLMRDTLTGREPLWQIVPEPHTRCENADKAKETIKALKKFDGNYSFAMFKAIRIRDDVEMFNDFVQ
jgi:hypothetical protein